MFASTDARQHRLSRQRLFRLVCEQDLQGVVGKRLDAPYAAAKAPTWVKVLNPAYSQLRNVSGRNRLAAFVQHFTSSVLIQLRSVPVGFRVDRWLRADYPELADLQASRVKPQLEDNLKSFGPDVRAIAPRLVYDASIAMNATFALFWEQELGFTEFVAPFRSLSLIFGNAQECRSAREGGFKSSCPDQHQAPVIPSM